MSLQIPRLGSITQDMVARVKQDGFLIVENCLSDEQIDALLASFPRIFAGDFDTGVYPDEWHWREGQAMTSDTYGHLWGDPESDKQAMAAIEDRLFGDDQ